MNPAVMVKECSYWIQALQATDEGNFLYVVGTKYIQF